MPKGFVPTAVALNCGSYRIELSDDPKDLTTNIVVVALCGLRQPDIAVEHMSQRLFAAAVKPVHKRHVTLGKLLRHKQLIGL